MSVGLLQALREDAVADRHDGAPGPHAPIGALALLVRLAAYRNLQAVAMYRLARHHGVRGHRVRAELFRRLNQMVFHVDIGWQCDIGRRLVLRHVHGTVIGQGGRIGDDAMIFHGVTIGRRRLARFPAVWQALPILGDRVTLGANAVVAGPITVGDDVIIGAGAVVTTDVPQGATVRAPDPVIAEDRRGAGGG